MGTAMISIYWVPINVGGEKKVITHFDIDNIFINFDQMFFLYYITDI